jgi:hypothetical protein
MGVSAAQEESPLSPRNESQHSSKLHNTSQFSVLQML